MYVVQSYTFMTMYVARSLNLLNALNLKHCAPDARLILQYNLTFDSQSKLRGLS